MKNQEKYQPGPEEIEHAGQSMSELESIMSKLRYEVLTNPEFQGKKIVFIMRGVPGSGKSTIAKEIAHPTGVIHSTDQYFYDEAGQYKLDLSKLPEYHGKNFEAFCNSIESEKSIIVLDNTNIKRWEFERYLTIAKAKGYTVREVEIPPPDASVAAKRNIHGIPEHVIRRMIEQYEK